MRATLDEAVLLTARPVSLTWTIKRRPASGQSAPLIAVLAPTYGTAQLVHGADGQHPFHIVGCSAGRKPRECMRQACRLRDTTSPIRAATHVQVQQAEAVEAASSEAGHLHTDRLAFTHSRTHTLNTHTSRFQTCPWA